LAHQADWCFVVCRTDPGSRRHHGLSYLLVPMDQPGVEVRPILQLTRTSEFSEVFFDGARADRANVVGAVGDGWKVALATLAFERGVALLGYQLGFVRELDALIVTAQENGRSRDPAIRQRLAQAHAELTIMRYNTLRSLDGIEGPVASPQASIAKLYWGSWHRRLGELALDVLGPAAMIVGGEGDGSHGTTDSYELKSTDSYELNAFQRAFLNSRAETIYGGSNQIQRNIIGERVLGLPSEPKGTQ
jgi:alkylation response protein AidB-like acyl-CoA dehydrogenase